MGRERVSNVIELPVITTLDLDPDRVLNKAIGQLEYVVLIGYTKDGEFYFASNKSDGADAVWVMEMAKKRLLDITADDI